MEKRSAHKLGKIDGLKNEPTEILLYDNSQLSKILSWIIYFTITSIRQYTTNHSFLLSFLYKNCSRYRIIIFYYFRYVTAYNTIYLAQFRHLAIE